ncbi:hypothetical protein [Sphingobium yanoikuyae]|uniref:hypothetical protein n=1 Tax=Sphingobium yanoikuyae TaxID=13690 RepID=UPI0028B2312D|nr:hypothetical protein [Sphingobium yanoikuyae]
MNYQGHIPAVSRRVALSMAAAVSASPALAAAAPVHDRAAWDRAYHEYRRLRLRMDAYYKLGPFNWANEEHTQARLSKATDPNRFSAADRELRSEEERQAEYYRPVDAMALELINIPAHDLDAVAIKMKLHDDHLAASEHDRVAWGQIEIDLRRLAL